MKQQITQITQNVLSSQKKWSCKHCDYITLHKGTYERHLISKKHKRAINPKKKENLNNVCEICENIFFSRTTLWRHKKKCLVLGKINKFDKLTNELEKKNDENKKLIDLLNKVVKQNNEIIPRIGNTNNTNNNISINVILNEKCKDAMNLTDFVEKLSISLDDLMYTKNNGYVKGISNILVKQLKEMSVEDRPIHCSDPKLLQFYVKDANKWEKDEKNNKVNISINKIQKKQIQKIKVWTDKHPNFIDDDFLYIEYQKMVKSTMCLNSNENNDIKKTISDIVCINELV
jgi:hypothetical protein